MRADGSIKSLTTGISTVDESRHGKRQFMKFCSNWRNDQIDGLSRRPGMDEVSSHLTFYDAYGNFSTVGNFKQGQDIFKPFEIDGQRYWLYNDRDVTTRMAVFDEFGVGITLDQQPNSYLRSADGNNDIRLAVSGDTVFVANTKQPIRKQDFSGPIYENHSMLTVRHAPQVYSTVVVKWEYPDYSQATVTYEVGQDHPEQPIPDIGDVDNGVNTIADQLASDIRERIIADGQENNLEIDNDGATIVFRNVTTGNTQREFSAVVIQDGSGGAFLAINGTVEGLEQLPRYSHPGALLEVRPDSATNRGKFYMRATSVLEADIPNPLPAPTVTVSADEFTGISEQVSGFTNVYTQFGDITPYAIFPAHPLHLCNNFTAATDINPSPGQSTLINVTTFGPVNDLIDGDQLQFVEIWDDTGLTPVRVAQAFMYLVEQDPDNGEGKAVHAWQGTIDGIFHFTAGTDYKVYFSNLVDNLEAVPEVRWVEDSAPGEDTQINPETFPHVLYRTPEGTFQFGSVNKVAHEAIPQMVRRQSGDDVTNPFPSFIDKTPKDIATFQNRLCILSDDKVSMSVTNQAQNWFRGTVVQLLDTSPISIQSTSAAATALSHFVEHNNDLMVFGPVGQFRFDGRVGLTPSNAALAQAASYPCQTLAVPKSAGNDVFFPTTYGESAGLSQFSLDPQIENLSVAKPVADLQIGMMPGEIEQIVTAPNLGILIVRLKNVNKNLYVMEFEPQEDILKPIEPAWSVWNIALPWAISSMRMTTDALQLAMVDDSTTHLRLMQMELFGNRKAKTFLSLDYGDIHLESRTIAEGVNTAVTTPLNYYEDLTKLKMVQGEGCPRPGTEVGFSGAFPNFTLDEDMNGGNVHIGYPFASWLVLPRTYVRDEAGTLMEEANLSINDYTITLTGHVDATVYREHDAALPTQEWTGTPSGADYVGYAREQFRVQVGWPAQYGSVHLIADTHVACDIHQIEWTGKYYKKGRRF